MADQLAVELLSRAIGVTLVVSAPILAMALVVGLVVSIAQAATSVQEMTLTFIPKLLAILGVMVWMGAWMLEHWVTYTVTLWREMGAIARAMG
jgi:flagellar biosynthetic protein FliQ